MGMWKEVQRSVSCAFTASSCVMMLQMLRCRRYEEGLHRTRGCIMASAFSTMPTGQSAAGSPSCARVLTVDESADFASSVILASCFCWRCCHLDTLHCVRAQFGRGVQGGPSFLRAGSCLPVSCVDQSAAEDLTVTHSTVAVFSDLCQRYRARRAREQTTSLVNLLMRCAS